MVWTAGENAIAGPCPMPEIRVVASGGAADPKSGLTAGTAADPNSSTAPSRNPGASGLKVTFAVQVPAVAKVPVHVPALASEKSSPVAPCVTTLTEPIVVPAGTLRVTGRVLLHGTGVVAPDGQTLTAPKSCGVKVQLRMSLPSAYPPVDPVKPTKAELLVKPIEVILKGTPVGNRSVPSRITSMHGNGAFDAGA